MTVAFRNVDVPVGMPIECWPFEAIVTVLERGSVTDWAVLTRAVRADPWGSVARQLEEYLAYERPRGLAPLVARVITSSRSTAEASERAEVAREVDALVRASALTSAAFAERIGTSASRLSTYRTGRVTPSAALLVRMRRVVGRLS
ncbi:MAG: helix-turn-helix transcriptional regulator [Nostocoides sp.]